ncbi:MAG: RagB/SusD family nutrient uptake outer membrane protein [Prevotella sp.]|jgi:hypothetical protein|nr:RagB/SusD family nutrient uptake outer membrane protein [Prevotella sp.]MCR5198826.1 RagB/SusD family nutrient uptake outer membrane protein [Prevotella sp.]
MNLSFIKNILPAAAMVLSMGLSSCTGDLDVDVIDPRKDTNVDAQKLFNKCYAEFVLEGYAPGESELDLGDAGLSVCYRLLWNANELTTDEAICGWTDKGIAEYDYNTFTPANDCLYGLFWRLSFGASICNQYLKECADHDATMTAEVHFLRALYYYFLLDNYGNPAFSETVGETPRQIQSADLFAWIVKELEDNMDQMLPASVRKKGDANYGRADQSAAWMLLARLYLNAEKYTGKAEWEKAKTYAEKVINESGRSIWMGDNTTTHKSANGQWSAYQMLFMADNDQSGAYNESIFAFILDGATTASWGASTFLFAASWDSFMRDDYPQMTDQAWGGNRTRVDLIEKFLSTATLDGLPDWKTATIVDAARDDRALFYGDNAKGDGGVKDRKYTNDDLATFQDGLATTKYTSQRSDGGNVSNGTHNDNDIMLMRLAEAYLIYAEAEARAAGSNTTLTQGTKYINDLRTRANNPDQHTTYTLREILDERARELYFEGVRRTDLIRYGYFGGSSYTWQWKGGVQEGGKFGAYRNIFPIPQTELATNKNLTQNPGY